MVKYFCQCLCELAIKIHSILLFFNWISNLLLKLNYFLRVLFKKLFLVINLLLWFAQVVKVGPSSQDVCELDGPLWKCCPSKVFLDNNL